MLLEKYRTIRHIYQNMDFQRYCKVWSWIRHQSKLFLTSKPLITTFFAEVYYSFRRLVKYRCHQMVFYMAFSIIKAPKSALHIVEKQSPLSQNARKFELTFAKKCWVNKIGLSEDKKFWRSYISRQRKMLIWITYYDDIH